MRAAKSNGTETARLDCRLAGIRTHASGN